MTFAQYLAAAPPDEFFWWSAVPAVLGIAAFVATFVFIHRARLIEDMPTSRLRSVAQGYVEVEGIGRMMQGPPILCPLTATRSIWWRYKVERKETRTGSDGKTHTSWETVDSGLSDDSFLLDDGTGSCVVNPVGAQVVPSVRHVWYGHRPRPDVGPQHGRGFWRAAWCAYRYTEELIFPEHQVYALGTFRTQTGAPESFEEQADLRELLAKWKHDKRMMALLDVNRDGTVDMKEWEAARRMALNKVRAEHVERAVTTPDLNVLAKPKDRRPFILSGVSQALLLRRYRFRAIACLMVMGSCLVFFLWTLHARGVIA